MEVTIGKLCLCIPCEIWIHIIHYFSFYEAFFSFSLVCKKMIRFVDSGLSELDLTYVTRKIIFMERIDFINYANIWRMYINRETSGTVKDTILQNCLIKMSSLETLEMVNLPIRGPSVSNLQYMTSIINLNLRGSYTGIFGIINLQYISTLTNLRQLDISSLRIQNDSLQYLVNMTNLVKLNISSNKDLTTACFNHLYHLTNLTTLIMDDTPNIGRKGKFWIYKGKKYLSKEIYDEAYNCFIKAITYNPSDTYVLSLIGKSMCLLKDYDQALYYYNRVLTFEQNIDSLIEIGKIQQKMGKFKDSLNTFYNVVVWDKNSYFGWFRLGVTLAKLSLLLDAKNAFETTISLISSHEKDNPLGKKIYIEHYKNDYCFEIHLVNTLLGDVYFDMDNKEIAMDYYFRAIKFNPNIMDIINYQYCQNVYSKEEETSQLYKHVLSLYPNDEGLWYTYGLIHFALCRFEDSIFCFDKALAISNTFAPAYDRKGEVLFVLKKYNEALDCHNQAIIHDEYRLRAWKNKEKTLVILERRVEAEECKNQGIKIFQF